MLSSGAVGSSKSMGGLPATVLLWGAEGSNGCLQTFVPGAEAPSSRAIGHNVTC